MKITLGQLKQLIREQIEEDWRDFATSGEHHEAQLSVYDRNRYHKHLANEREDRNYRDQQQSEYSRRVADDRQTAADKEQAEMRGHEERAKKATAQAQTAAATKEATAKANKLIKLFNSEDISNALIKNSSDGYQQHFGVWMKNPAYYNKSREAWNPDILKALQNMTISNGPLKGQNAAEALKQAELGELEGPGFMSKVKGFFGMKEEIQQIVKEEVARQLRNRR